MDLQRLQRLQVEHAFCNFTLITEHFIILEQAAETVSTQPREDN
jgi:hypothetical protein